MEGIGLLISLIGLKALLYLGADAAIIEEEIKKSLKEKEEKVNKED